MHCIHESAIVTTSETSSPSLEGMEKIRTDPISTTYDQKISARIDTDNE